MNKLKIRYVLCILLLCFAFTLLNTGIQAQDWDPINPKLTRGKMWWGNTDGWIRYPGYIDGGENQIFGGDIHIMVWKNPDGTNHFRKQGFGRYSPAWHAEGFGEATYGGKIIVPYTLTRNYNFSVNPNEAEEFTYFEGLADSIIHELHRMNRMRVKTEFRVWGLPKYDDFIILKQVLINEESYPIDDFYYCKMVRGRTTPGGSNLGFDWDIEYQWADYLRTNVDEQGQYIFYDGTSYSLSDPNNPIVYNISPGDVTGDRGDPGNIRVMGSVDRKLYSPQVYTKGIVNCTPNKNGEKQVKKHILVWAGNLPGYNPPACDWLIWQANTYEEYWNVVNTEQPREDWATLNQQTGGNNPCYGHVYERLPYHGQSIGPYYLAPGDSVELFELWCAGEMDRNITLLGGLDATQNFLQEGIADLRDNWESAMSLIDAWEASGRTNWNAGITEYPPPPPANTPRCGNEDELIVEPFIDVQNTTQGFDIKWKLIPDSYVDPIKGVNDVVGYKLYRSQLDILGPWTEIDDLTNAEAADLVQGGLVTYRDESKVGIPTRYLVTSYDSDGLESAQDGYSYYSESARNAPSNNLSDVRVIPNPFKQVSGLLDPAEEKRMVFVNVPSVCTIKIFTVAGEHIQTIEHNDGFGSSAWGSSALNNYMGTKYNQNIAPGVYIFHVESQVSGHEGESKIGKFVVIK